jgi:hypothetical protein
MPRPGLPHSFGWLLIEPATPHNGYRALWEAPCGCRFILPNNVALEPEKPIAHEGHKLYVVTADE